MKKLLGFLVVLAVAFGAFWYMKPEEMREVENEDAPEEETAEKKPALSLEVVKNMEIVSPINEARVTLRDGAMYFKEISKDETWEVSATETEYFTKLYTGTPVAYGDLDGDGISEAAFVLVSRSGGTGTFYDLVVVAYQDGKAVWLDGTMLGDRVVVNAVRMEGGAVAVDMLDHGPGEPLAVATLPVTKSYRLQNSKLVE